MHTHIYRSSKEKKTFYEKINGTLKEGRQTNDEEE